jgi:hypothetical protein
MGSPNGGPTSPPDKVKPLDELLEVGRRNNPGWVAEDLEP